MNQEINDNTRSDQKFYIEDSENPLAQFQTPSAETTITTEIPTLDELEEGIVIALGEDKKPLSILHDDYCEEMAHPHLFPTDKFGYKVKRKFHLTPKKYFNQRLLHHSQQFASDTDYIFFTHAVMQKIQLNDQINIAMKKIASDSLNPGKLSKNFKATMQQFIAQDKAYSFMSSIKGTPAYWENFLFEVLAMVKQLGILTFFMTLSCADLRRNELVEITSKFNRLDVSDDVSKNMTYQERCNTLNKNPFLVAFSSYFLHRSH